MSVLLLLHYGAARAMLMRADILLLDEPTNHLDVANVRWLEQYLVGLSQVTSMIVSHDSGFLDTVCTDIIHYESQKLVRYKVGTSLADEAWLNLPMKNSNVGLELVWIVKVKTEAIALRSNCPHRMVGC